VACHLEELKHCSKSLHILKDTLSRLPITLEATYDQILSRIKDVNALNAKKLLLWLAFAETPLLMKELAKVVEFDMESQRFNADLTLDHPVDVLKVCPSLVTEMKNGTVQLAHASIKEYILDKKRKIGPLMELDPNMGHFLVGHCSLAYMLYTEEVSPDFDADWDDEIDQSYKKSLLKYSALFWPKHILACNEELAVMDKIKKLFEPGSLAKWTNAYNYHTSPRMQYHSHLQIAALNGLIETVKWLLLKPEVVKMGYMPDVLYAAARNGHIKIVTLLFEKGLVSASHGFHIYDIWSALDTGHDEVFQFLYEQVKGSQNARLTAKAITCAINEGQSDLDELLSNLDDTHGVITELVNTKFVEDEGRCGHVYQLLLEKEPDIEKKKILYGNALFTAIWHRQKITVGLLLDMNIDMNAHGNALGLAINEWIPVSVDIVKLILDKGMDVNVNTNDNLLYAAIKTQTHGYYSDTASIIEMLLEKGANVNLQGGEFGNPLQLASYWGYEDIVQLLLKNGANVNAKGGKWGYAIWAAMSKGRHTIVHLLRQHGASLCIIEGYDSKFLQAASFGGYLDIVKQLLDAGIDVNTPGEPHGNALIAAALGNHWDIIKLLLDRGANVNATGPGNYTVLEAASKYCPDEVVKVLLELGADVNAVSGSALQTACARGKRNVVQMLLEWEADVNKLGPYGGFPLSTASSSGHKEIVHLLCQWNADVNLHPAEYSSALCSAVSVQKKDIVEILLEKGANLEDDDSFLLSKAASIGDKDIVEILLRNFADVTIQGEVGHALRLAGENGFTEIAQLLQAYDAKYLGPVDHEFDLMGTDSDDLVDNDDEN
jgi:ankyrin repeat protein